MNVVFFPFSHVDETQRTTLTAFFSPFIFLPLAPDLTQSPAMAPLVENRTAVPVFTSRPRLDEVASRVNAWMDWAALHQGNEHNLKNLIQDTPYLTDHLGPAPIQSEIRARLAGSSPKPADNRIHTDPLLFSIIARLTDAQNEAIDQALTDLETKQAFLFAQLRGDSEPRRPENAGSSGRDPGEIMTRERIRAWAACAMEENLFSRQAPLILVTTSAAVFEQVAANAAEVINALDIDDIKVHEDGCDQQPVWRKQVLSLFDTLADGSVDGIRAQTMLSRMDDACHRTGRIQVQTVEGPDLEKQLNLPGRQLRVCRVSLKP
jgi:hypothetical protein